MAENILNISPEVSMIWQMLVNRKVTTNEQLEEVQEESQLNNTSFTTVLYNYQIIDED